MRVEGLEDSLETQAVVTTHGFPSLSIAEGPHQRYEFVWLKATAHQAD